MDYTSALTPLCVTRCGHLYHIACITRAFRQKKECPYCKTVCSVKSLVRVYMNATEHPPERRRESAMQLEIERLQTKVVELELELKMWEEQRRAALAVNTVERTIEIRTLSLLSEGLVSNLRNNSNNLVSYRNTTINFFKQTESIDLLNRSRGQESSFTVHEKVEILRGKMEEVNHEAGNLLRAIGQIDSNSCYLDQVEA